ncbi:uncharacterized protein LOC106091727 [Stomoxys calcitrans]|uniref:uncharacterized protein LOC106091727 n=1 Tax=Stomoxys calcitrans TaxID=35570 RepID=UPI0027E31295|nr:uncharacterized protein LOC106091727 [Stomoxys calcitrans]
MGTFVKNVNGGYHLSYPSLRSELVCLQLQHPATNVDFAEWLSILHRLAYIAMTLCRQHQPMPHQTAAIMLLLQRHQTDSTSTSLSAKVHYVRLWKTNIVSALSWEK